MGNIIKIDFNYKELLNKINLYKKFNIYLEYRKSKVRELWNKFVDQYSKNEPCTTFYNVEIVFKPFFYEIVHSSGLIICRKIYFSKKFILNRLNLLKIILKHYNVEFDTEKKILMISQHGLKVYGKISGYVVDYLKSKLIFYFYLPGDVLNNYSLNIKVCKDMLKLCDNMLTKIL